MPSQQFLAELSPLQLFHLLGEIGEASGTQIAAVTHWNYKTICRGSDSLIGRLIAEHDGTGVEYRRLKSAMAS
jgi:hypothetical protein